MTTMAQKPIKFSKIDYCPVCNRQLCRRKENDEIEYVEFRHRGSMVLATEMIVACIGCGRKYLVSADKGIINEVDLGTE